MPTLFDGAVEFEWPSHVSSSQRSWWTCRLRAALSSGARLRKRSEENVHMLAGTVTHEALQAFYKRAPADREERYLHQIADAQVFLDDWSPRIRDEALENVHSRLKKFYRKFGQDETRSPMTIQLPEGGEMVGIEVPLYVPLPGTDDHYLAWLDFVYEEEDGTIIIEDFKSSSTKIEPTTYTLMNPQITDYMWGAREQLFPDRDIEGRYLFVTPYYVQRVDMPRLNTADAGEELATLARERRELPIVANRGYHCNSCRFSDLCALRLTGGDVRGRIEQSFRRGGDDETPLEKRYQRNVA